MSIEALSWAAQVNAGSPAAKLILLAYAAHARDDGTGAFCPAGQVARYAECSPLAVPRLLRGLVENGLIRISRDSAGVLALGRFDLAMSDATCDMWRAERSQAAA